MSLRLLAVVLVSALALLVSAAKPPPAPSSGYSGVVAFSGSATYRTAGSVLYDSAGNLWAVATFQGGSLSLGTASVSTVNRAIAVFKRVSNTWSGVAFEVTALAYDVEALDITVDSTGKATIVGRVSGDVRITSSLVVGSGNLQVNSILVIQVSSALVPVTAFASVNTVNAAAGSAWIEANNAVGIGAYASGNVALGGQSITNAVAFKTVYFRLDSTGAVVASAKLTTTGQIFGGCYNPSTARSYVVATMSVVGIADSGANPSTQGPYTVGGTGGGQLQRIACAGASVQADGYFTGSVTVGTTTLVATSSNDAITFNLDTAALAPVSANQGHANSEGRGVGGLKGTSAALVWSAGHILNGGSLSGVAIPSYTGNYVTYLATVSAGSVYANVTSSDSTRGSSLVYDSAINAAGSKIAIFVNVGGTSVKFGTLTANAGLNLIEYTV
jgi:hypothetical protein